jgi:hypothetical protein
MANRAGYPVKTVSEPGVVSRFQCAKPLYKLSGTGAFIWTWAVVDNPVRIGGDNSLVLLRGLFLAMGTHMRLSLIVSDPPGNYPWFGFVWLYFVSWIQAWGRVIACCNYGIYTCLYADTVFYTMLDCTFWEGVFYLRFCLWIDLKIGGAAFTPVRFVCRKIQ